MNKSQLIEAVAEKAGIKKKDAEAAQSALKTLVSELDSAGRKGILTRNAVSRKKSRMMRLYNVSFSATAAK